MPTPNVVTSLSDFRSVADCVDSGTRVPVTLEYGVTDPFEAYKQARDGPGGAYLETTGGQSGWGYFGIDPVDRLKIDPQPTTQCSSSANTQSSTLQQIQSYLDEETVARGDCPVPYPCGMIGWLSYDIARELESLPTTTVDERKLPRAELAVFDRLAAWRATDSSPTLYITTCPKVSPADDLASQYDQARTRCYDLIDRIETGDPAVSSSPPETGPVTFDSDCSQDAFAERVRKVQSHIRDGDTFQANISQRLSAPAAVHPVEVFDALRTVNPAPYSALLEYQSAELVSASPELLVERTDNRVLTEPIAGTRPRGSTKAADSQLETELRTDEKERAEHAMLVDLERNDLGKIAAYGTVDVSEYRRVDRYSEVMHLVSLIEGRLRSGTALGDVIAATFPGGTITGAPKPETMNIIDRVERTRRGPYTGSVGIFGFDDNATLNIIIRTLVRYQSRYDLRVGAGIVDDSDPDREYEETLDKARALINALDTAVQTDLTLAASDGD